MEFRVLGPVEVREDGRSLPLGGPRKRALLATLLLRANRPVSTEAAIDALWGERPPANAATTVHVYVSHLRKLLGRDRLVTTRAGYVLEIRDGELDRSRFERLVAGARIAEDPAERAALLREALALWRGPALADLRYEAIAETEGARLDEERLVALEERLDAELALGLDERLIGELEQLTTAHPLRERFHEQLMLALYRSGRQADALAAFRRARRMLRAELGIEPGHGLRRLEQAILNHDRLLGDGHAGADTLRLDHRVEPREERKVVTVLFADIAGYTQYAERVDPEDARALLRRYHASVRRELERFGGTVEKFVGDAVMAVFGAPATHEDDAERAVRAAFAVRDAIAALSEGDPSFAVETRIGVNTGETLAVVDADVASGEGLVVGDVVNTAARLQSAAPVGGILVGAATMRATRDVFRYRRVRAVTAKGKRDRVAAWEATGIVVPLARSVRTHRMPFVGRAREQATLADALERARRGHVERVTVVGEPGIGKTRLVSEFVASAAVPSLTGRCLAYGAVPYTALSQVVKAAAGVTDGDSAAAASAKLDRAVRDELAEAEWIRSHLRVLTGLERAARAERRELFAAWRRFLESLAAEEPLVVVFEDVQWADEGLAAFLDHLTELGRARMLVLCTARPEAVDGATDHALVLEPLSDGEIGDLLASLLGEVALPEGLLVRIGGNPLFAHEFARSLEATGDATVPDSVQSTIAARIDLLPPLEKDALHAAAVLGKSFAADAVAALEQIRVGDADRVLESLERRTLVVRDGDVYGFAHVLIRDVAYTQVPRARRARHHLAAADWLDSLAERPDERLDLLAHHLTAALDLGRAAGVADADGLSERTRRVLVQAGEQALNLHAYERALGHFERALSLRDGRDALEGVGRALHVLGRAAEGRAAFERALEGTPEPLVAARLNRRLGTSLTSEHRFDDAETAFDRAAEALAALPEAAERWREWIDVQIAHLTLLYWRQEPERMDALLERAAPVIERWGEPRQRAELLASRYLARLFRERYHASDQTLLVVQEFLAARQALGDPVDIARAHFNVGFVHMTRGDVAQAQPELELALATAERTGDATLLARSVTYLALLHRRRREVGLARTYAEQALAVANALAMTEYVAMARATLAWAAWVELRRDEAESEARAAVEAFAAAPFASYPWEWTARMVLLALAVERGRVDDARVQARAMLDLRQQPLPRDLARALSRPGSLVRAVELAHAYRLV
jgi:DNA-binding SARP family transcriptional activator/Tfp pilus assembly protein PilF